jgi:hypothetical protein
MAVCTRPVAASTSTYSAGNKAALAAYHKECFLIFGEVVDFNGNEEYGSAYSKFRKESSDFRKMTLRTEHDQFYNIVIFSNQEDDIAELIGTTVGSRIAVMAREIDYGPRYQGCHRVTSVVNLNDLDRIRFERASGRLEARSFLMGISQDQLVNGLVRDMIDSSSQGWKLNQTPTSRAIPL